MSIIRFPKLSFVCSNDSLRPSFQNVLISKDDVVATNGHCLVKHPTNEVFSEEFINDMPESILINMNNWKLLERLNHGVRIVGDKIEIIQIGYTVFIPYKLEDKDLKYPNYKILFTEESKPVENIAFNPMLIDAIRKGMFRPYDPTVMRFKLNGDLGGVIITNTMNGAVGLLMPQMIN